MDYAYLTSEKFIHDDLLRSAQLVVDRARELWERGEPVFAHAIAWPSEGVSTDDGKRRISGPIILPMPEAALWQDALKKLIQRTKAYGLFLLEFREKELYAVFESPHGAQSWRVPIERHGDVRVLGDQRVSTDRECLGLLWSPKKGSG